ncbi:replication initiator protein A [Bradyrhizobium sediminis]|uniref:Replication initiator protein A n=1 Tax=Bradyrhizobium sediminis TaxID=2840469 RepID=A0A975NGA5_9BRAD|nr:replication initiator protein A [Bradyrhizobium sediminis]QWG14290.1 replication initiator protein A [Bradyrhizobium sediminis]
MENTLLRVSGALFCHDPKRASTRTREIALNSNVKDRAVYIRPDPALGQPGPLAHKIFVALIKKHSNYGRPIQSDISFTKRELVRLIGRKQWGGRDSEELTRALHEIQYAFVRTAFKTSGGHFAEHTFNIFPEVYLERRESEHDPVERCTVTLARPIISSLNDEHFTCLNHTLMAELGTIGQALYMRLFFHFANLYTDNPRKRPTFRKRYEDICTEWLGGITVHTQPSVIERDQLGSHLRKLREVGFLASYSIAAAADGKGLILTFRPGIAFIHDYDRFYRGRHQPEMQFEFQSDKQETAEPLKVAYMFLEKRTGQPTSAIPYVPSKDVETAKFLLTEVSFDEMPQFLSYALSEAKKTSFDVKTLGGLKQYLTSYINRQERRRSDAKTAERAAAEKRAEDDRIEYSTYRRRAADALFASLPLNEQQAILALVQSELGEKGSGPMKSYLADMARARITAERYPDKIDDLATWDASRRGGSDRPNVV